MVLSIYNHKNHTTLFILHKLNYYIGTLQSLSSGSRTNQEDGTSPVCDPSFIQQRLLQSAALATRLDLCEVALMLAELGHCAYRGEVSKASQHTGQQ